MIAGHECLRGNLFESVSMQTSIMLFLAHEAGSGEHKKAPIPKYRGQPQRGIYLKGGWYI
jgi:hypothetical protein